MWEMFPMLFVQPLGDLERLYNIIIKNINSGGICLLANPVSPFHSSCDLGQVILWASVSSFVERV